MFKVSRERRSEVSGDKNSFSQDYGPDLSDIADRLFLQFYFYFLKIIFASYHTLGVNLFYLYYHSFFFLVFGPRHATCRILAPRQGIEHVPPAVEAQNLNHWTAREVPVFAIL